MGNSNNEIGFIDELGRGYQSALKNFLVELFACSSLRYCTADFLTALLNSDEKRRASYEKIAFVANAAQSKTRDAAELGSALFAAGLRSSEIRALRELAKTKSDAEDATVINALSKLERSECELLETASSWINSIAHAGERKYQEESGGFLGVVAIALVDCIPTWDSKRGSLAVYAKRCMETAMIGEIRNSTPVRGPQLRTATVRRIREAEHELWAHHERDPSDSEIACHTGISVKTIHYLRDSSPRILSINAPTSTGDEREDALSYLSIEEVSGTASGDNAIEKIERDELLESWRQRLENILAAQEDPRVKAVVLRLAAIVGSPELACDLMIPSKRAIRRLLMKRGEEISNNAISDSQHAIVGIPRSPVQAMEIRRKLGSDRLKALLLAEQSKLR